MIKWVQEFLFKIARSKMSGYFIGFIFAHASALIPVKRIVACKYALAFQHPVPHWECHYLVVPKKRIPTLLDILTRNDAQLILSTVFEVAQEVAHIKELEAYTVLVNGGQYQDVPQLHFHIASGEHLDNDADNRNNRENEWDSSEHWYIYKKQESAHKFHMIFVAQGINSACLDSEALVDLVVCVQKIVGTFQLKAFTLLINAKNNKMSNPTQFHLVANV